MVESEVVVERREVRRELVGTELVDGRWRPPGPAVLVDELRTDTLGEVGCRGQAHRRAELGDERVLESARARGRADRRDRDRRRGRRFRPDGRGSVARFLVSRIQAREHDREVVSRERLVEHVSPSGEFGDGDGVRSVADHLIRGGVPERRRELVGGHGTDEHVGQAQVDRLGTREEAVREGGEEPELSGCAREQPRGTDVGQEADSRLGKAHARPFGHDAMGRVTGQAHPTPEHEPVHERDDGLGVAGDRGVEAILGAPERLGSSVAASHRVGERDDVAARAESAVARPVEQHGRDGTIGRPRLEGRRDEPDHLAGERVDRLGAVERHAPHAALDSRHDDGGDRGHRPPPSRWRPTMSRMISLVPSRIWCTRRSRTTRSMPYSCR